MCSFFLLSVYKYFFSLHLLKSRVFYVMQVLCNIAHHWFLLLYSDSAYMIFPYNGIVKLYTIVIFTTFVTFFYITASAAKKNLKNFVRCDFDWDIYFIDNFGSASAILFFLDSFLTGDWLSFFMFSANYWILCLVVTFLL